MNLVTKIRDEIFSYQIPPLIFFKLDYIYVNIIINHQCSNGKTCLIYPQGYMFDSWGRHLYNLILVRHIRPLLAGCPI